MDLDYTPQQAQLRDELRAYMRELISAGLRAELEQREGGGPLYRAALAQLGADRWLGIGWPREYGGQDRSAVEQFIFFDEVQRAGFPIPILTLCTIGPTLIKYGTARQKDELLPRILRGQLHFSIGYTEPEAGTDLASLKTRAVRDGDVYVVDGQKVFTSLADHADYIWLAARTDPDAPKHEGISILMVDTSLPGFSQSPIVTLGGNATATTYYEQVRVPVVMRVGEENRGWKLITTQLNHERVALMSPGPITHLVERTTDWARQAALPDGRRVIDQPWARTLLARARAHVEVLRLMAWRNACQVGQGHGNPAEASMVKVYGSETFVAVHRMLLDVLGPAGALEPGSEGAILRAQVDRHSRATLILTFGGGTNEVQREIIAMAGLRLPRAPR
jgi:3-oxocholest-4-en-26-oyl-CoA dehydrogenase alpha subunit